jgi:hypothetical protein
MATSDWENFLFFGGEMPSLVEDIPEVPMPVGFYVCMDCKEVTNYWKPGNVCENCERIAERQQDERI